MTQPIHISCPHCHRDLKVAGATAGKQVRCPRCQRIIRVPESAEAVPSGPPRWLLRTEDGKTFGPVSRDELESWVREGRVSPQCRLSAEKAQQWIWASEMFPELAPNQPQTVRGSGTLVATAPYQLSDKSRLVAGLLGLLLPLVGIHGVHRLYTGHIGLGILMLITCGGCGIWQLIDVILVFAGCVTDADGRPLRE